MAKAEEVKYELDSDDGLPVELVREWSEDKHLRLRRFVHMSHGARRKLNAFGRSSYIDLYCGPGRARNVDTQELIDGSPVVAAREAQKTEPFSEIHLGDAGHEKMSACFQRIKPVCTSEVFCHPGTAEESAAAVGRRLDRKGLHLAFLDPYSIGALPFSVIAALAPLPHMDMIVHVSIMDLQRNLRLFAENGVLEAFAPGFRSAVDLGQRDDLVRRDLFAYWRSLFTQFGHHVRDNIASVRGPKNQPLYWLVIATRHPLAERFWKEAIDVNPQRPLFSQPPQP